MREARLWERYGITVEEYARLLKAQGGVCFICQRPAKTRPLNVDHDHRKERELRALGRGPRESVRGLLCYRHNKGIGWFSDNIGYLQRAVLYLQTLPAQRVLRGLKGIVEEPRVRVSRRSCHGMGRKRRA